MNTNTNRSGVTVGTTFTDRKERGYRVAGERRVHAYTTHNVVTGLIDGGFTYDTTSVTDEVDRPEFAGTPTGGSMAWFGLDNAIAAGRVKLGA